MCYRILPDEIEHRHAEAAVGELEEDLVGSLEHRPHPGRHRERVHRGPRPGKVVQAERTPRRRSAVAFEEEVADQVLLAGDLSQRRQVVLVLLFPRHVVRQDHLAPRLAEGGNRGARDPVVRVRVQRFLEALLGRPGARPEVVDLLEHEDSLRGVLGHEGLEDVPHVLVEGVRQLHDAVLERKGVVDVPEANVERPHPGVQHHPEGPCLGRVAGWGGGRRHSSYVCILYT